MKIHFILMVCVVGAYDEVPDFNYGFIIDKFVTKVIGVNLPDFCKIFHTIQKDTLFQGDIYKPLNAKLEKICQTGNYHLQNVLSLFNEGLLLSINDQQLLNTYRMKKSIV